MSLERTTETTSFRWLIFMEYIKSYINIENYDAADPTTNKYYIYYALIFDIYLAHENPYAVTARQYTSHCNYPYIIL